MDQEWCVGKVREKHMSMVLAIMVIHTILSFVIVSSWMSLAGLSSHLFRLLTFVILCLLLTWCHFLFFNLSVFYTCPRNCNCLLLFVASNCLCCPVLCITSSFVTCCVQTCVLATHCT